MGTPITWLKMKVKSTFKCRVPTAFAFERIVHAETLVIRADNDDSRTIDRWCRDVPQVRDRAALVARVRGRWAGDPR